jgi:hypothetical protein
MNRQAPLPASRVRPPSSSCAPTPLLPQPGPVHPIAARRGITHNTGSRLHRHKGPDKTRLNEKRIRAAAGSSALPFSGQDTG